MRKSLPEKLEQGRVRHGYLATDEADGAYGAFMVQGPCGAELRIIAAPGRRPMEHGWEHVSVSIERRPPNWQEMAFVKDLFWNEDECVVQFHPPKDAHVNNHPHCLHLWRHATKIIELPPEELIGVKGAGDISSTPQRAIELHKAAVQLARAKTTDQ
jgi:hypothetical protein